MFLKCVILLCSFLAVIEASDPRVSFIVPCNHKDNVCLLSSANKALPYIVNGVPELGIRSYNPLIMKDIVGDYEELKLLIKELVLSRLLECKATKLTRPDKLTYELDLSCPILVTGLYKCGGKLFVLPVEGEGEFEMKTNNLKFSIVSYLKEVTKDDELYYEVKKFDYTYNTDDEVTYVFHNLFNGDESKAAQVHDILKQSWKEITSTIAKPIIDKVVTTFAKGINKVFDKVPAKYLELE